MWEIQEKQWQEHCRNLNASLLTCIPSFLLLLALSIQFPAPRQLFLADIYPGGTYPSIGGFAGVPVRPKGWRDQVERHKQCSWQGARGQGLSAPLTFCLSLHAHTRVQSPGPWGT